MLDSKTIKKVEEFVYPKPRTIQEIAQYIRKNWRTADRYVQEIEKEYGTLATRTFREGTRGALKIVYWASVEKFHHSIFQEKLAKEIEIFKRKEDFSAFNIYQHISAKNKKAIMEQTEDSETNLQDLKECLEKTEKQLLIFSGNISWENLKNDKLSIFKTIDDLVKKSIPIKILCRVDFDSKENVERMLSLNFKYGKEIVEIRHCEQPLRGFIVDNKILRLKEIKEPTGKINELVKRTFFFYTIIDKEWIEWISRIFWNMFSSSTDANKRVEEIKKIQL